MWAYANLEDALYECFKDIVGTDEEDMLFEDSYIKKKLKEYIGTKEFKKFDELDEKYWKDAWRTFDSMTFELNKRQK
ncbi:hypothetical protein F4V43_01765 [Paenibacillus spiritus]|uniref:Uncharacterized protein n=1 Tax=Paenibacillus spiritus TaxID=2496557 RepID=A0A5J5GHQ8_9BACL|nr:hypothetical protein [Paenibacillus spiritus]KAA9007238.1 hypothetical protein F4V43_01765 [Paenibacillus spiritus]